MEKWKRLPSLKKSPFRLETFGNVKNFQCAEFDGKWALTFLTPGCIFDWTRNHFYLTDYSQNTNALEPLHGLGVTALLEGAVCWKGDCRSLCQHFYHSFYSLQWSTQWLTCACQVVALSERRSCRGRILFAFHCVKTQKPKRPRERSKGGGSGRKGCETESCEGYWRSNLSSYVKLEVWGF